MCFFVLKIISNLEIMTSILNRVYHTNNCNYKKKMNLYMLVSEYNTRSYKGVRYTS